MSRATLGFVHLTLFCVIALGVAACASFHRPPPAPAERPSFTGELVVTATAYNSLADQSDDTPTQAASGKRLRPGMRTIAVSDDLDALGLREGVRIRIDGLSGVWEVADRMAARWRKRIDIYMGNDEAAARAWGVRRVKIRPAGAGD